MSAQTSTNTKDVVWPSVSVIVPSYRHARFVSDCLDSIVATKYPNLEIVIINDASPDNDDEVIRAWLARHPGVQARYILHEHNQGLTKTLNEAIDVASGEYFSLLAADDLMLPDGIHDRVEYLIEHPQKLAVFADCHVIDHEGHQLYQSGIEGLFSNTGMRKVHLCQDHLIKYEVVFHWAVPGPVFLCRRELFDVVGNYDETLVVEDWDMYLRIAATGRLGFVSQYVAQYRIHGDNTADRHRTRMLDDAKTVRAKNRYLFSGPCRWHLQERYLEDRYHDMAPGFRKRRLFYTIRIYKRISKVGRQVVYRYFGVRNRQRQVLPATQTEGSSE